MSHPVIETRVRKRLISGHNRAAAHAIHAQATAAENAPAHQRHMSYVSNLPLDQVRQILTDETHERGKGFTMV